MKYRQQIVEEFIQWTAEEMGSRLCYLGRPAGKGAGSGRSHRWKLDGIALDHQQARLAVYFEMQELCRGRLDMVVGLNKLGNEREGHRMMVHLGSLLEA
jgi:hypothetical protein